MGGGCPGARPKANRSGRGTRQCSVRGPVNAHACVQANTVGGDIWFPSTSQDIWLPLININNHTDDILSCCVFCYSDTRKTHKTTNKTHTPYLDDSTRQCVSCDQNTNFILRLASHAMKQNHHTSTRASDESINRLPLYHRTITFAVA